MENNTIGADQQDWMPGQNVVYNQTEVREFHILMNGKNQGDRMSTCKTCDNVLKLVGVRCDKYCFVPIEEEPEPEEEEEEEVIEEEPEPEFIFWSDPTSWPNETLPVDGDTVEIKSWNKMILDIPETPKLKAL